MRRQLVCRVLAIGAIVASLAVGLAGAATAGPSAPSIPGIPDCKDAPTAQLPGSGITGFLDEGPKTPPQPLDPFVAHPRTSVYEQYGYAGLSWHTYDLGCGGGLRDTDASIDTTTGNLLLSAATWGTAATNGLHNKVSHPDQYMAPLDDVVAAVTQRLHDSIWSPWGAAALIGVGALLLLYSLHGRLSAVTSAAAWALLVLAVVAGIGQYPTRVATFFDDAVTSSTSSVNSSVTGLTNLPASADPARAQGALVVDRVLYDNWLRGTLGATDTPAAKKWGPALFKASAFTWAEADQARHDPDAGKRIAETKAENWNKTAAEIQQQDPVAYGYLQGKSGGRAGTGLMVALGSTFSLLFRLVSDIFLCAGLVMLRLLVMMFPAIAVIGVMAPMAAIVRRVFAMGGAAVVNVVAFGAGSAVHTTIISAILTRATNTGMGVLGLVLCLVVTAAAFVVLYPLLSFTTILGHHGDGGRLIKRGGPEVWNYALRREATKDGIQAAQHTTTTHAPETAPAETSPRQHGFVPSEAFARPLLITSPSTAGTDSRAIEPPPSAQLAVEAPRREPPHTTPQLLTEPTPAGEATDPAYALTSPPSMPAASVAHPTAPQGQIIPGVLVADVPQNARELPTLTHDSHTQIRRDGIGPRLYDPQTKQTVLRVPDRVAG